METVVYRGRVAKYYPTRNFGFIDAEDGQSYFFFYDKAYYKKLKRQGLIDNIRKVSLDDEVEFSIRQSPGGRGVEAYALKFIRNEKLERLAELAKSGVDLMGRLKWIRNNEFVVVHEETGIEIPVEISMWETNTEAVYADRIHQFVEFRLNQTVKLDKLKAILIDRIFSREYHMIARCFASGEPLKAMVTGSNMRGFFARLFDGKVDAFIPIEGDLSSYVDVSPGDMVLTKVMNLPNSGTVRLGFFDDKSGTKTFFWLPVHIQRLIVKLADRLHLSFSHELRRQ